MTCSPHRVHSNSHILSHVVSFLFVNSNRKHLLKIVSFVPSFHLFVSPSIPSCFLPVWLIEFVVFPSCKSSLGPFSSLHHTFTRPTPTLKPYETWNSRPPVRSEVVSVISMCSFCQDALVKGSILGCLRACSICEASSPLTCSILNVSSHEFSVTHRKAGQTLTRFYTPGSRIGLRSLTLPGRGQRPSLQGSGLRFCAETFSCF